MFEQTLLKDPETARKPYSMVLSLILQILLLGVLCLVPIIFTQVLPTLEMKSVLAAPPKPPALLGTKAPLSRMVAAAPRLFRLANIPLQIKPLAARASVSEMAPDVSGIGTVGGDPNGIPDGAIGNVPTEAPPPLAVTKPKPQATKTIRVGSISGANLIYKVQPAYPPLAKSARLQGMVEFTAIISRDGSIENLTVVRGHPLLIPAARDAVLQWRYRPTLLNGEPVEVITDIIVNFTLNQ